MIDKKSLVCTVITIILVGIVTGLFLGGNLLPARAMEQLYNERVLTAETKSFVVHGHDDLTVHEHKIATVEIISETTPHGYFHDFATPMSLGITTAGQGVLIPELAPDEVWVISREFLPLTITVPVGTTVTWTNKDNEEHTVTFDDGLLNIRLVASGTSFNHTFTEAGTFTYYCDPHREMKGKVIVR